MNGPQTPLATKLKPAEVHPHIPETPLGTSISLYPDYNTIGDHDYVYWFLDIDFFPLFQLYLVSILLSNCVLLCLLNNTTTRLARG